MSITISYKDHKKTKEVVTIDTPTIKIGSLLSNELTIADDSIESIHAIIEYKNEDWVLIDPLSKLGILINDKKVTKDFSLSKGDIINIGNCQLIVENLTKISIEDLRKKYDRRKSNALFNPREARASGATLEIVSYWKIKF